MGGLFQEFLSDCLMIYLSLAKTWARKAGLAAWTVVSGIGTLSPQFASARDYPAAARNTQ
jgi:hypothetical protein